MERAFYDFPTIHENGRLLHGTTDLLTMDFSDLMNECFKVQRNSIVDLDKWNSMFEKFKSFWNLDIENPYTSIDKMNSFLRTIETLDNGEIDEYSKELVEEHWRKSIQK